MKNFQIRLADEVFEEIKDIAEGREVAITDVIRNSLEYYIIAATYAREGRRLMWEDLETGERVVVHIPGLTSVTRRARASAAPATSGR